MNKQRRSLSAEFRHWAAALVPDQGNGHIEAEAEETTVLRIPGSHQRRQKMYVLL